MGKIEKILFMGSKNLGLSVLKTIFCLTPEKLLGVLPLTIQTMDFVQSMMNLELFVWKII